jgi:hypothetical protein
MWSFLRKLRRGELPLVITFWPCWFAPLLVLQLLWSEVSSGLMGTSLREREVPELWRMLLLCVLALVLFIYMYWANIGVWYSAARTKRRWKWSARIVMIVLGIPFMLSMLLSTIVMAFLPVVTESREKTQQGLQRIEERLSDAGISEQMADPLRPHLYAIKEEGLKEGVVAAIYDATEHVYGIGSAQEEHYKRCITHFDAHQARHAEASADTKLRAGYIFKCTLALQVSAVHKE